MVDNPDVVKYVQNKAKTVGVVNVLQVGAITKGQQGKELADIRGMYEAGIPAISEDGRSVMNSELYREAMEIAAELDIPVLAHCEDINLVNGGVMNEDAHSKELGLKGITNSVEDIIVARDIMLSRGYRCKITFVSLLNKRFSKNGTTCEDGKDKGDSRSMPTSFYTDLG